MIGARSELPRCGGGRARVRPGRAVDAVTLVALSGVGLSRGSPTPRSRARRAAVCGAWCNP